MWNMVCYFGTNAVIVALIWSLSKCKWKARFEYWPASQGSIIILEVGDRLFNTSHIYSKTNIYRMQISVHCNHIQFAKYSVKYSCYSMGNNIRAVLKLCHGIKWRGCLMSILLLTWCIHMLFYCETISRVLSCWGRSVPLCKMQINRPVYSTSTVNWVQLLVSHKTKRVQNYCNTFFVV